MLTESTRRPAAMRGGRLRAVACWVSGHRWCAGPTSRGVVVVLCERCGELVSATFVDEPVLGLHPVGCETKFGALAVFRDAVGAAASLVAFDDSSYALFRADLTARPGASVDGLAQVAATLARMVDPSRPHRALRRLALASEQSAVEFAAFPAPGDAP